MYGFPKHINSKVDIYNLLPLFESDTKSYVQQLLDTMTVWVRKEVIEDPTIWTSADDNEKMVVTVEDVDGVETEVTYRFALEEDPNCKLYRLGLTVAEANQIIA